MELSIIWFSCLYESLEKVSDAVRGECGLAKDAHDFEDGPADFEVMLNDGNETIGDDGNVNLYSDGILRFPPEAFDLKVLLNPLEKQFHLPAIFVKQSNVLCTEEEIICVVSEGAMQVRCIVDNPSDDARILLLILLLGEANGLVFEYVICSVENALAIDNLICRLSLLPDDEECSEHIDSIEPSEVKVTSVKHIARQWLVCEPVHRVDIVHLGVGDSVENRNLSDNINLSMDSDARLCASELCPSEYGHAEVDSRRVDGIESSMQLELLRNASGLCNRYHVESELLKDTMISEHVGLRKHLPVDGLVAKAEVFGLLTMCDRNICEFPQTSAAHELAEHQNQQVVPMRHRPAFGPVVVFGDEAIEMSLGEELGYLCKNKLSYMHICSDLESDAKVGISKPGQGIGWLKRCA